MLVTIMRTTSNLAGFYSYKLRSFNDVGDDN